MAKPDPIHVNVEVSGIEELGELIGKLEVISERFVPAQLSEVVSEWNPVAKEWRQVNEDMTEHEAYVTVRHPASEKFHALLREAGDLHDKKQKDYGRAEDPFANVRGSKDWTVPPWVGAMIRANDKMKRLQSFVQNGELHNESARDSLMDIAVYSLIAIVMMEEDDD